MTKGFSKICFLVLVAVSVYSEVTFVPLHKVRNTIWEADSLFLGASMIVVDSTKTVTVILKENKPKALGALYFMVPGVNDSAKFIFHNMHENFPEEADTVVLGRYPKNTQIYFMYTLTDTSTFLNDVRNKKLFSGQNRQGIDQFTSEISGPFGKRWAIVGDLGSSKCEVGFAAVMPGSYRDIRFYVLNVNVRR